MLTGNHDAVLPKVERDAPWRPAADGRFVAAWRQRRRTSGLDPPFRSLPVLDQVALVRPSRVGHDPSGGRIIAGTARIDSKGMYGDTTWLALISANSKDEMRRGRSRLDPD